MTDLDAQAKALYERNTNGSAPPWENLGDVTRQTWREEVQRRQVQDQLKRATADMILIPVLPE